MKRVAALVLTFTCNMLACGLAQAQTWNFEVRLDGKRVGSHRFTVTGPPAAREVHSVAHMDVKLLGLTVFRYRHEARERWRGDCLADLQSSTDDDGEPLQVAQTRTADDDCLMTFAYWNPALPAQNRLLNPQTGRVEQARFERLPDATLTVREREVQAKRWHLTATPPSGVTQDLVMWLDRGDASWLGLDARVKGGRLLTYRLK
ncbi:DUF6134 family protein [Roseateles sp. DC23W]|uniref:DUF6134 family protein n=1 Tax=Pelomonas dachongensis TaxID=3299029 RepID=A0ABW7ENF8_9BURK